LKHLAALLLMALGALPLAAQTAGEAAQQAARDLETASVLLDQADGARDRVAALTETVKAFESGLTAMRQGLRQAAIRETELSRKLASQEAEVTSLLGILTTIGDRAQPQTLLHPQGALGMARAGMLLADVTPGLAARAQALRSDLDEISALRALQQNAANVLEQGLAEVQAARTELSQAIANRTDLPRRFTEDPVRTAILISGTETLDAFASGLSQIAVDERPEGLPRIDSLRGTLPLPVSGVILRSAGETDAAGITRPGIVIATPPRALVTTPTAATVRYAGPLLDYGLVTILEPQSDLLFVIAGLDQVFGEAGQVLPEGSPVGLMGGQTPGLADILSPIGDRGGEERPETLYIEVREAGRTVDPLRWFAPQ